MQQDPIYSNSLHMRWFVWSSRNKGYAYTAFRVYLLHEKIIISKNIWRSFVDTSAHQWVQIKTCTPLPQLYMTRHLWLFSFASNNSTKSASTLALHLLLVTSNQQGFRILWKGCKKERQEVGRKTNKSGRERKRRRHPWRRRCGNNKLKVKRVSCRAGFQGSKQRRFKIWRCPR